MKPCVFGRSLVAMLACAGLALVGVGLVAAAPASGNNLVYPPYSHPFGDSYGTWSAEWWQWAMELPVEGNPTTDTPDFDVTDGQSGKVWYLAAFFGTGQRTCTIPKGKTLFVGLLNAEDSTLEGFPTKADQKAAAADAADHIVVDSLFLTIDGTPVTNLSAFRFQSPQFKFFAPTPWIFGDTGGKAKAVADGYFVMLKKLKHGQHVLHYGGAIHYSVAEGDAFDYDAAIDMTYYLTQLGSGDDGDGGDD